jgi:hypothetical protein
MTIIFQTEPTEYTTDPISAGISRTQFETSIVLSHPFVSANSEQTGCTGIYTACCSHLDRARRLLQSQHSSSKRHPTQQRWRSQGNIVWCQSTSVQSLDCGTRFESMEGSMYQWMDRSTKGSMSERTNEWMYDRDGVWSSRPHISRLFSANNQHPSFYIRSKN